MKAFFLVAVLAVATAEYRAPYQAEYQTKDYKAYEYYSAQPYSYSYVVKDEASYNDYSHSESSDGKVVTGFYRVYLPDGRSQIVNYKADSYGYVADVKHEGEARYPEYRAQPTYYTAPAVTYTAPAPATYTAPAPATYTAPVNYRAPVNYPVPAAYRTPAQYY